MPDRHHITLFLPDSKNPYMQASAAAAAEAAASQGDLALEIHFAEGRFEVQVHQIYVATRAVPRPQILLVMPVQESALNRVSEQVMGAGLGWFWLSHSTGNQAELQRRFPALPVCLVSPNQREAGRIQGRQLRALLPQGGQILYIQGRMTNQSARLRAEGLHEVLDREPATISIVGELDGNWSALDTAATVTRWLRTMLPTRLRPDAVACQNDDMAAGVIDARNAIGGDVANIPVLGCDGLRAAGRQKVDEGTLAATVILPTATDRAVQLAAAYLTSRELPPLEVTLEPQPYPDEDTMVRMWRRPT